MLSLYLTRSRVRADLFALFFLNPTASYYLRELSRRLNISAGTLARELRRFSQEGLFHRDARGKEVFYRLNRAHPLYPEIKGIIEKTCGIPVRLAEAFESVRSVRRAFIYGSFASGAASANSDIDLLLVGRETLASSERIKGLERTFGRTINVTVYAPEEFEAKRKDRSEFLFAVMRGPLIQIKPVPPRGPAEGS